MNFGLSDEQIFLRDAARDALSRFSTLEAARAALDGAELPDLWPSACEAGWPGLAVGEAHGGAGLGAFDAVLVLWECGRVLAPVPLLGHIGATALLDRVSTDPAAAEVLPALAAGERRAAFVAARPPEQDGEDWTVDGSGVVRGTPPVARLEDGGVVLEGAVRWVVDLPDADLLVVAAVDPDGRPAAVLVEASAQGVAIEQITRYDATRLLGHLSLDGAAGVVLEGVGEAELRQAWYLAQALLAAEAAGSVETTLEMAVDYAKQRFTFGRPIGSYQAIKHGLVEMLRRLENARSLLFYAGWAYGDAPDELPLAASAARVAAGGALDHASRQLITTHGGIGATWEHDAPLFFRRAQLSRRLLGGGSAAADAVAAELLAGAA